MTYTVFEEILGVGPASTMKNKGGTRVSPFTCPTPSCERGLGLLKSLKGCSKRSVWNPQAVSARLRRRGGGVNCLMYLVDPTIHCTTILSVLWVFPQRDTSFH